MNKEHLTDDACIRWLLPLMTAGLMSGIMLGETAVVWLPSAIGLVISIGLSAVMNGWKRSATLTLAAICLGCVLGYRAYHPVLPAEGMYTVTGTITQELRLRKNGQMQTILSDVTLNDQPYSHSVYWTCYPDEPLPDEMAPGTRITIQARLYHPSGETVSGGFDFREYLLQRGIHVGIYGISELTVSETRYTPASIAARLRHHLTQGLLTMMGTETGGHAAAMLLGERSFLPEEDAAAFRKLGIAHILSVSGYHVGVLVWLLRTLMTPLHMRRSIRFVLTIALLGGYGLLTGGDPPIIRAVLLYAIWEMGHLRAKQNAPLHTLCIVAGMQLIYRPALLFNASFQLSYGAMLGLLMVSPVLYRGLYEVRPYLAEKAEPVTVSLSAQFGILPAQLHWYGTIPVLSLPANVVLMQVSGILMGLYWLTLCSLPIPGLNLLVGHVSAAATTLLMKVVHWVSNVAGAEWWLSQPSHLTWFGWAMLMLAFSVLLPRGRKMRRCLLAVVGTVIMAVSLMHVPGSTVTYMQFSAGEADAALLRDRDTIVVIDTGEDGQELTKYLVRERLSIDVLILTHLHSDHAGGLRALLDQEIPIETCYLSAGARTAKSIDPAILNMLNELTETGTELRTFARGDVLTLPSGKLTGLWPASDGVRPGMDANHSSLVILAELRGTTMLLTGDLSSTYEMYAAHRADILKVAHHGSRNSTSQGFLAKVEPQVLILSCGTESRYAGFVERAGDIPLYSTNIHGTITICFEENTFSVNTYLTDAKEESP